MYLIPFPVLFFCSSLFQEVCSNPCFAFVGKVQQELQKLGVMLGQAGVMDVGALMKAEAAAAVVLP